MSEPSSTEIAVARNPTKSETRVPWMSSVSTDRPRGSVPSQNSADGGSSGAPGAWVTRRPSGSASSGANTAISTNAPSTASPRSPERWPRKSAQVRRSASRRRRRAI